MRAEESTAGRPGRRIPWSVLAGVLAGSLVGIGGATLVARALRPAVADTVPAKSARDLVARLRGGVGASAVSGGPGGQADEARLLARHRKEPMDPRWRDVASRRLRADLAEEIARAQASLVGVQCRSSTCVLELEWKDHASAQAHYQDLVASGTRVRCTYSMRLAEPSPVRAAYRARLIVDCAENRDAFAN
jgi:hypothetical protein